MSSIVERANAEADAVEAELGPDEELEPDGEEAEEEETEPDPGNPVPSESDLRKMGEKIDREDTRHQGRLREILGSELDHYKECPLCQIAGWVLPYPPGGVEPLQRAAIMAAMGDDPAPDLKFAPEAAMCPVCDGNGETLTHSKNPLHRTKICEPCMGKGWMNKLELTTWTQQQAQRDLEQRMAATGPTLVGVPAPSSDPYPDYNVPFIPLPQGVPDGYGRPAGHPMYGSPNRADGSAI